jgi:phosphoribulokinase
MSVDPVFIGIAGDSGAGKSTFVKDIATLLGRDKVRTISFDDYHSLDRVERKAVGITPLHPRANNLGLALEHLFLLKQGKKVLKPIYDHSTGSFGGPEWVVPMPYIICEGLHPFFFKSLAELYDMKVYYDTEMDLKFNWKVKRDTAERGYTVEQVAKEIRLRQRDIRNFVEPQCALADIIIKLKISKNSSSAIGVDWKEPVDDPWIKKYLKACNFDNWQCFAEWYAGRKMNVFGLYDDLNQEQLKDLSGIFSISRDLLSRVQEKEVVPYRTMLVLFAARIKQIRASKDKDNEVVFKNAV